MPKNSFAEQVYAVVKTIPRGQVMTYGQIAKAVGSPKAARAVGNALHHNQNPETPCFRVVNKDGRVAKNFAFGGSVVQKQKLEEEGVIFQRETIGLEFFYMRFSLY